MSEEKEVVYAVSHWPGNKLQSAVVLKRTEKQVKISRDSGEAFGFRTNISPDDPCLAPTPAEAYRRAIANRQRNIDVWLRDVRATEVEIANLKNMLAAEIAKDQPK